MRKYVGYNAVPPPPTGLFAPLTIDLSNSGLKEFQQPEFEGYGLKENKCVCEKSSNEVKKSPDAPIIEDWVFDCDEDESGVRILKSDNVQQKPKQADQPRKMVQKPVMNNVKKGTGQKEVRPVWNNAMRINHQNISNSRRNFAPKVVLTKSGKVPISTARQSSSRAASPVGIAKPINTAAPKSFVNVAKTRPNAFQKSHLPSRRPFYQQTTLKNRNLNDKVNTAKTAKVNSVNTAKGNRYASANWGTLGLMLQTQVSLKLKDKKELAIPGQTVTGKEFSNPLMADSLPKTILPTKQIINTDGQIIAITEASVRRHLQLVDADGISSLPNTEIFEQLTLMGTTFSRGDTPRSDDGSKKLNELTELSTKLFDKVTSLEKDLKQTKKVYGKALTKLVKKVKYLEDKLMSTTERRRARMVISDDEEDLVLKDPSKQGRMTKTKYEDVDVETEYEEVEYELDQTDTLQHTTPTKFSQGEEKSLESSEVQLDVLSATKILADASRERIKTYKSYTRRRRSTVSSRDSTAGGLFSTTEEILSTDENSSEAK
ncbi:hypothetical protein Tco_0210033 [Tanacetum coccineum]